MRPLHSFVAALVLGTDGVRSFQGVPSSTNRLGPEKLHVASPETDQENEAVPYIVARGDGSTGGGGLPMPKAEEEDGLRRPKVGAEMPDG